MITVIGPADSNHFRQQAQHAKEFARGAAETFSAPAGGENHHPLPPRIDIKNLGDDGDPDRAGPSTELTRLAVASPLSSSTHATRLITILYAGAASGTKFSSSGIYSLT